MKKAIFFLIFGITAAVITFGVFAWQNLRGIGPAIKKPAVDGSTLSDSSSSGTVPIKLPPGFTLSLFAKGLGKPRVMTFDPNDTLLVSIPAEGRIVALPDGKRRGAAEKTVTVIDGLNRPHGLALRCDPDCKLYIAEENQVIVCSYDKKIMKAVKEKKIADLPRGGFHVTRTLLFLPKPHDDTLLISVGSSCNVCEERDWRRAKILSVPAGGGKLSVFASGLRNAVFMTINPRTKAVWATEMGRDMLGDNLPPDEIDIIRQGGNYGWPFCYGKNVHDDEFDPGRKHSCREPETLPSFIDIPAHSAPLGLAFFRDRGRPDEYAQDLLVAYHGSWNRSIPAGYKIVRMHFDKDGNYRGTEDFATGWLVNEKSALGRPVDIVIRRDGTIFVTDDEAGVVYRITWNGKE